MKIKHLIRILQAAADKEREVYIPSIDGCTTTKIGYSFDDNNDLELYETGVISSERDILVDIQELEQYYIDNEMFRALKTIELLKYKISELEKENTAK